MSSFDILLAELSQVVMDLTDATGDERARLEARRDELRAELRKTDFEASRPTAELLDEHARLAARLDAARKERVKKVPHKHLGATQTVGGGVEPEEINRLIDEGNRYEELLERFEHLDEILRARGALS
ncbi:MAG: hypothetical protein HKN74_03555 [Acidimicrobiia bacterium]|nr:hypothetical protein [Acidimicrobiia bacterium]MBT8215409.1 hypothetical protein [Acidimicrobiia bacterium]NNF09340.1 hypothetical protein [Acidimicrobiia bacterium]NNL71300.1 hypothetical protein [Acidimicrobiia bacterium]